MYKRLYSGLAGSALIWSMSAPVAGQVASPAAPGDTASTQAQTQSIASAPDTGNASGQVEDIIVRAQRRDERLQNTPVSITAVSGRDFDNLNARDLFDLSRAAPNIQFAGNSEGSGLGTLTIRGIGQQQPGLLSDPGAAAYVDEVYHPRFSNNTLSFDDVSRIEVLRGPQGTLFGKNSIGGAVSIYSTVPTNDWSGRVSSEYGNRDLVKLTGALNAPIVDDVLAVRIAGERVTQDGFIKDLETGQKLNDTNYYSLRGTIRFTPAAAFELLLRADYTHQNQKATGSKVVSAPDPSLLTSSDYETRGTAPSRNKGTDKGVSATANLNVGIGTIRSITAYRVFTDDYADDSDGTPLNLQSIENFSKEKSFSQELQFNGNLLDNRLQYTTGLFYLRENIDYNSFPRLAIFSLDNFAHQITDTYAAFGQATYKITDAFDITAGVRWSEDKKNTQFSSFITGVPVPLIDAVVKHSWQAVTPKVTAQYRFTPDVMAYATVSRGFKSGGVNGQPIQVSDFQPFGQEKVTNYEVGVKTELLDKKLRLNVTGYRMDYSNIQIGITDFGQNVVKNAGKARIQGFEGDALFRPVPAFTLNGSFSYNDFDYRRLSADAIASGLEYGFVLPVSPKTTLNGGAEYRFALPNMNNLTVRADYAYRSKEYFNSINSGQLAQHGYGLLSARATFHFGDRWSVYGFGTNLTDKFYKVAAQTGLGVTFVIPGRPREYGIGASLVF